MRRREFATGPSVLVWALACLGLVFLLAPVLIVVPLSFSSARFLRFPPPGWSLEWYETFFTDRQWSGSVVTSVQLGLIVAVVSTLVGTAAAYGIVRGRPRGRRFIISFLLSPIIVPAIVTAISLYGFYARLGLVGNWYGIVAAHMVVCTPFVVVCVAATLLRFDPVYEQASQSLGASPVRTFWEVTLPNILPGVVSGALLAFIHSFDEVVLVLFVGGSTLTLPRKLWNEIIYLVEPTQAAASVVIMAVSTVLLVLWVLLQRRAQTGSRASGGR
jgi:putative spermidine/putrescine transport system permease protein